MTSPSPATTGQKFLGSGRCFVVMGAPASGKGTQCKMLAEKYGFFHLSTGDIFRDLAKRGTELGDRAKEYVDKGCFVPDEIVLSLIQDRLKQADVKERGCLLDGFPRTADQAQGLLQRTKVDGVLFLQVPEKTLVRRAEDRRIDPDSGDIYHLKYVVPPAEVLSRLIRRDLDDEHSIKQRIEVFKAQSRRVLPYFSGNICKVDATLTPDEVFKSMVEILESIDAAKNPEGAVKGEGEADSEHLCAICFEQPADFLVVPCGHQCGCEDCLKAVQSHSGRCPICRNQVESIQRVFRCGRGSEETVASKAADSHSKPVGTHLDIQDKLDAQLKPGDQDNEWPEEEITGTQTELVTLFAAPCSNVESGGDVNVMVSVQIADQAVRKPVDVCCLVDISGSMADLATYENEDGQKQNDGLTVLDIVKHAVRAVIKALQADDRLAVVAFDDNARTALSLTEMTSDGQDKALSALEALCPEGSTNIWGGLVAAMDVLREGRASGNSSRQQAVLLLTDGQPNIEPPKGHLTELRNYKDKYPGFSFQLNTFGFGYNLNSDLLLELASEGNGTYAFIPDAVIVGTTFVNSVANVLSTLSQSAILSLLPLNAATFTGPVLGSLPDKEESWGRLVNLGPLQYGQSREIIVPMNLPMDASKPYLEVILTYPFSGSDTNAKVSSEFNSRSSSADAVVALCRADTVTTGFTAIQKANNNKGKEAGEDVADLSKRILAAEAVLGSTGKVDGRLTALKADVEGRMSKSLNGHARYNRWGKHYLKALMRSHQLQVCTNFMDPGLQPYGGSLFRSLRETGDAIFLSLPPPTPSKPEEARNGQTQNQCQAPTQSPNMTTYYAGAGGGCFDGTSLVTRLGNLSLQVSVPLNDVRAGDLLQVADGSFSRVRCVICIERPLSKGLVGLPTGLKITPGHPVCINDTWLYARDCPDAFPVPNTSGKVYNVVLESCHMLLVNGVQCATWGHNLKGPIIGHPFFGTDRVLLALQNLNGWSAGLVFVQGTCKDSTGMVVGFVGDQVDIGHVIFANVSHQSKAILCF
jgi:adenylate kinase